MTVGLRWASRHALFLVFVVVVGALSIMSPTFRSVPNLVNIVEQQSIIGVVACGMLLMILLGGFDLSVGAVGAATSVIAAWTMSTSGIVPGVLASLALGAVIGLCNGLLIAKVGINPFVATLGMQSLITGVLFVFTDATPVYGVPEAFTVIGLGRIGAVPVAALIYAAVVLATWAMLRFTTLGHHIYAVGGSPEASRLAGIRVHRVTITAYVLGALAAAIGGLILLGQTSIGQPSAAQGWPLSAIAAVAIAGVALTGGSGGVGNVVIGTLLLGVVSNALNLFGISPYWQPAFTGAVIIGAVGIDMVQRRRRTS
ncbi:ABC transporter permease [Cellulomonas dongxiuzhuiae]|uniref:Autoinducer 2 import system permease protein LsrD n=1 Tax=Cellulomonas dongxiuzhuiae TaxID=2819979 RepID=A0ABX8GKY2_9CELL|nr:ABC transporter permease [Cellulomonas dongxiuzhuiae]MBO3095581.1 ABC transporter permease [Cellulomonas dongxiuzhuiae]QWC16550.1 ABC transporter permease [Cellulomonas dongxiuzhuiae]